LEQGEKVAILCENKVLQYFENQAVALLDLGKTEEEMAANLYALLRKAEQICQVLIAVEPKKKDGVMVGVLNRFQKAVSSKDIPHC
jgi:hypothetical protein